jgi:hypothetical protein
MERFITIGNLFSQGQARCAANPDNNREKLESRAAAVLVEQGKLAI